MNNISRMARDVASVLANLGEGRGLLGVEIDRRGDLERALVLASGCTRGTGRQAHRFFRDGARISSDVDGGILRAIGDDLDRWLSGGDAPPPRPTALPAGTREIAARIGISLDAAIALTDAVRHVEYRTPQGAVFSMARHYSGMTVGYRSKGLRWRDGVVHLRHRQLPQSWSPALTGAPLGRLVQDPVVSDRVVRKVCDVEPREGVLRIVTADEGGWTVVGEN